VSPVRHYRIAVLLLCAALLGMCAGPETSSTAAASCAGLGDVLARLVSLLLAGLGARCSWRSSGRGKRCAAAVTTGWPPPAPGDCPAGRVRPGGGGRGEPPAVVHRRGAAVHARDDPRASRARRDRLARATRRCGSADMGSHPTAGWSLPASMAGRPALVLAAAQE